MNCNFVNLGAVYTIVFSDEMFINLLDSGDISDRYKAGDLLDKAIMINYTKSLNRDLNNEITSVREKVSFFRHAYAEYSESLLIFGLVRFIGFFMGAIVILMTASMLYFKQIMAAEEERHLYNILRKIGMSEEIEKKAIVKRLLPVFMVPLVVGIIHSVFAMKTANTIIFSNLITTGKLISYSSGFLRRYVFSICCSLCGVLLGDKIAVCKSYKKIIIKVKQP